MDSLVKKKNKVILITGCSSGIGLSLAKNLSIENYNLSICARNIKKLKKEFSNFSNILITKADLNNQNNIKNLITKTIKKFGKIDILINNAGVCLDSKFEDISIDNLKTTFNINLFGPIMLIKASLPYMKKNNFGRIINISSGGSINCAKYFTTYSASKASLNTISKSLTQELKKFNIKINTFSPGPCKTKMFPKNPLSPSLCIPSLKKLFSNSKSLTSGEFFWFNKKINIIPKIKIDWSKPHIK